MINTKVRRLSPDPCIRDVYSHDIKVHLRTFQSSGYRIFSGCYQLYVFNSHSTQVWNVSRQQSGDLLNPSQTFPFFIPDKFIYEFIFISSISFLFHLLWSHSYSTTLLRFFYFFLEPSKRERSFLSLSSTFNNFLLHCRPLTGSLWSFFTYF